MNKSKFKEILSIIIGSMLVSLVVVMIHSKSELTEGGQIGIELLLLRWFKISPTVSSILIDILFYILGFLILNQKFRINAIIGTLTYSIAYFLFDNISISMPLIDNLLLSSIIGGLVLGFGCGLVVKNIGSCGGDDSLALILNKTLKIPLFLCYFGMDIIIIILSLSYIDVKLIHYSFLTSFLSSLIISLMTKKINNN